MLNLTHSFKIRTSFYVWGDIIQKFNGGGGFGVFINHSYKYNQNKKNFRKKIFRKNQKDLIICYFFVTCL